jgi:hypothetical protein
LPPPATAAAEKQRGVIYALAPSPKSLPTLWAGTDDGLVWLTTDGGAKWNDVTPPALTPWSKVTQIDASHFDAATAYVSVSRFRVDDLAPYIFRTHDGGKIWQLITAGLDAAPVNAVREDPVRPGLLFAATETSMWVSFNDGDLWQPLQLNLPHTSMRDVMVHDNDLVVATHGRSFWILDDITPLRQIDATAQPPAARLFQPAVAIRVRDNLNTDTPLPPDEPAGENPPEGAILDFYLHEAVPGPVALEILDAKGKVVRHYASTDQPEVTAADFPKLAIPPYWPQLPATLLATAGLHRWVWDLHYAAPDALRHSYGMAAVRGKTPRGPRGSRALPGEYQVKLTVGGSTYSAPLTIRMDPRVRTAPADWQKNFDLQGQFVALINRGAPAVRRARSLVEQIDERAKQPNAPAADLAALKKKLQALIESRAAPAGTEPAPNLAGPTNEATTLYGSLDRADAAPTQAQIAVAGRLADELKEAVEVWEKLLSSDVPALNARLKSAALPELQIDSAPKQRDPLDGDDDDDDLG